ncbi:predicted protein [Naegleria gruberi]|uniref:Predicted protein n=1 Tax=Naegleria gruberi TaxID=5762 RepID=D2UYD5_NAEGR|nr:uncharacterized protein NAEGRDRAFT_45148 [Naegleria gruberi]EFC50773.1 predicted protein [Naegleria gruberi]|eukprot:XP_002683517.1 predicted protein [Naegleria gruberi strain NEG-M]
MADESMVSYEDMKRDRMNMQDGDEEKPLFSVGQEYVEYDDGQEDSASEPGDMVVDFDVNAPDLQSDYYGAELYVRNYLQGTEYNYFEMAELVLGDEANKIPNPLTSVIKTASDPQQQQQQPLIAPPSNTSSQNAMKDDDEVDPSQWDWTMDMYGLLSLLDYKQHKKKQCMKQIKAFVLQKCPDQDKREKLCEVFDNSKLGIIVNERVINLPYEVGGMLHLNLFEELEREQKENGFTKFQYYLIITKVFHMRSPLSGQVKKVKDEAIFYKPEEQFYHERALVSFDYPIKSEYTEDASTLTLTDDTFQQGLCMIIESSKVRKILKKIKEQLLPNSAQSSTADEKDDE